MDKSTNSLKKIINKTVIILGDSKVGKTSFIRRYVENTFKENYYETLGVDYYNKKIKAKNETYSIQIWDTNGWENDRQFLNPQIYKICSLFIIMCSFDNYESYQNLENWFDHISNISRNLNKSISHLIPIALLVNKNDLKQEKKFKISDVIHKVKNLRFNIWTSYFSSKENNYVEILDKIDSLLKENTEEVIKKIDKLQFNSSSTDKSNLDLYPNSTNKSSFKIKRSSSFSERESKGQKSCCN